MPEVKVPELAESITEGTIAEWLKQVGDSVDKGEAILELETDKVNVEVVSEEAGVLQELLANEGDTVEVGQSIAVVGEGSGNNNSEAPKQDNSESQAADSNENQSNQNQSNQNQKLKMIMKVLLTIHKIKDNVLMRHHLHVNMHVKKALTYPK